MPSSWDVYYVVFLSALLALGIPALLAVISWLISSKPVKNADRRPAPPAAPFAEGMTSGQPESGGQSAAFTQLGSRINARFFLGVNASLVLIALALALIPCAGTLRPDGGQDAYLRALIAIISLAAFAGLGLLYASRKGDLSWIGSAQPDQSGHSTTPGAHAADRRDAIPALEVPGSAASIISVAAGEAP